jgi:putative protease
LKPNGLKIEGRNKGPDYIYVVTKTYKKALELAKKNKLTLKEKQRLETDLSETFNRGFISGFYLRTPDYNEIQTSKQSKRTKNLICIGRIKNFYSKLNVAEINADENFKIGEEIVVKGENTYFRQTIDSMEIKHKKVNEAKREQDVAIKLDQKARKNDLIYALR